MYILDEYDFILEKQEGKCAICGASDNFGRYLCVDHSHETGKIRGLLCNPCNQALGLLKDNVGILNNAIDYLRFS